MPPRMRPTREPISDEASTQLHVAPPRDRGCGCSRGRHGGGRMPEVKVLRARHGAPILAKLANGMHNIPQSFQQLVNILGVNRQPQGV